MSCNTVPRVSSFLPSCALIYCACSSCLLAAHQTALKQVCLLMEEASFQVAMPEKAALEQ